MKSFYVLVFIFVLVIAGCQTGHESGANANVPGETSSSGGAGGSVNADAPKTKDDSSGTVSEPGNASASGGDSTGAEPGNATASGSGSSGDAGSTGEGSQSEAGKPNGTSGAGSTASLPSGTGDTPSSEDRANGTQLQDEKDWVVYHGPIEHIFFHPLIVNPELAFDGGSLSKGYDDWFVTVKEFVKIVESLYANNYMLIDINSIFELKEANGKVTMERKELRIPKGKKPLVLSIDDMNYYDYMLKNGNVFKLILDANGDVATYMETPKGEKIVSRDNEIVPILDDFVKAHSDFSLHGAKGLIALTGYQGVLGYRTNETDSPDYDNVKQEAMKVIARLKATGWSFASHGYGHLDARKVTKDRLAKDTLRWKQEVEPLTGPTPIYVYPYGSSVLPGDPKYSALLDAGFHVLCSVGPAPYLKFLPDSLMMDRRHIDGIALQTQRDKLLDMFDANEVVDHVRPAFKGGSASK